MIRVAILTISDSASAGKREDKSGPLLRKRCDDLGWPVVENAIVPDSVTEIAQKLNEWSDGRSIDLILTTGGTGISARDHTPEATRAVIDRELPGVAELMRSEGREQTPFSVLSRGVAGTCKSSFLL